MSKTFLSENFLDAIIRIARLSPAQPAPQMMKSYFEEVLNIVSGFCWRELSSNTSCARATFQSFRPDVYQDVYGASYAPI